MATREKPEARTPDEIRHGQYDLIDLCSHLRDMFDRHSEEDPITDTSGLGALTDGLSVEVVRNETDSPKAGFVAVSSARGQHYWVRKDTFRAELAEVLSQYPVDLAVDRETRQYRKRLEALLNDDDAFGGPLPEHIARVRTPPPSEVDKAATLKRETIRDLLTAGTYWGLFVIFAPWIFWAVIIVAALIMWPFS